MLVLDPELTDRTALKTTTRQLGDIKAPLSGFVFNRIEVKRGSYGKGGYYARYGRYYDYHYESYYRSDESDDVKKTG